MAKLQAKQKDKNNVGQVNLHRRLFLLFYSATADSEKKRSEFELAWLVAFITAIAFDFFINYHIQIHSYSRQVHEVCFFEFSTDIPVLD